MGRGWSRHRKGKGLSGEGVTLVSGTMSHHLDSCWTKFDRAKEHLDTLEAEIIAHTSSPSNVVAIRPHLNAERTRYDIIVEAVPEAPLLRWGVVVGDITHNLRSALDQLATQLVLVGSNPEKADGTQVHFPIYDKRDDFRRECERRLPGVGLRQRGRIEMEQPYKRYHQVGLSPLRRLRELRTPTSTE